MSNWHYNLQHKNTLWKQLRYRSSTSQIYRYRNSGRVIFPILLYKFLHEGRSRTWEISLGISKSRVVPFIALTEIWLKSDISDAQIDIYHYNIKRCDRDARTGGGVMLYNAWLNSYYWCKQNMMIKCHKYLFVDLIP